MADLIVYDEEYKALGTAYEELGSLFETQIAEYYTIIENICRDGIIAGDVYENLTIYASKVMALQNLVKETLDTVKTLCEDYVSEIDDKDKDIYN